MTWLQLSTAVATGIVMAHIGTAIVRAASRLALRALGQPIEASDARKVAAALEALRRREGGAA